MMTSRASQEFKLKFVECGHSHLYQIECSANVSPAINHGRMKLTSSLHTATVSTE